MKTLNIKKYIIIAALIVTMNAGGFAQDSSEQGYQIALEAQKRSKGFTSLTVNMTMILKSASGEESRRELTNKIYEEAGDGDKSIIVFNTPRDVKGTAILTHSHKKENDDQWLYLPSIKRIKRISSRNKSGSVMGSEFAYEDLSSQEVEKYTYTFLRKENTSKADFYIIERVPNDKKSGYTKQIVWYDADYRIQKIEFYDRKKALLKTLIMDDYNLYENKYWRVGKMHMVNQQSGKETLLLFDRYILKAGLSANVFTKNSLKRSR